MSFLVEADEGSYVPNWKTNLAIVLLELSLLFWRFINTTTYYFELIWAFISSHKRAPSFKKELFAPKKVKHILDNICIEQASNFYAT